MNLIEPSAGTIFRSRPFIIASAGYFAVLCLLFWRLFTGDSLNANAQRRMDPPFLNGDSGSAIPYINRYQEDFIEQFSMFEEYQYRSARSGRFPTWNPFIFMGQPFHANGQSAMLFPTHWIYFLVNPDFARGPMAMLRLWISAMAMFCLLRKFGLAPTAAFAGGSAWAFGSFNLHWLLWPHSNASLSVPVALLGLDFLLLAPSWRGYAGASLCIAPVFLAGHPGTEYLCGGLIVFYCIIRLTGLAMNGESIWKVAKTAVAVIAALFTALLVSAAALLPLLMQIRGSYEYLDPTGHRGGMPPLSWSALWLLLVPEYFGRPLGAFISYIEVPPDNYIESVMWFGAIAFLLALAGMYGSFTAQTADRGRPWRSRFSFPGVFATTVFLLTLGIVFRVWPIGQLANALPGSQLTNLRRTLFAAHFSGAMLAACAVHQMLTKKNLKVAVLSALLCIAGSIVVLDALVGQWARFDRSWSQALRQTASQTPITPQLMHAMIIQFGGYRILAGAIILIAGSVLLFMILLLTIRRRSVAPLLRYLFAAVITFDVLLPAYDFTPIAPIGIATPPVPPILSGMIQQAGDGRMLGIDGVLDPNVSMHFGFRDIRGYDLPHDLRQTNLFKRLHLNDDFITGEIKFEQVCPTIAAEMCAYLDRSCVRAVMLTHGTTDAGPPLTSLKPDRAGVSARERDWPRAAETPGGVMVFNNPNAYPRTFLAENAEPATDARTAMNALLDSSIDLRDQSVFESAVASRPIRSAESDAGRSAKISIDDPERVVIDSQASAEHLLVLDDRMADGWRVSIDGKSAEALIANYLFRGVIVPGGHHTVEWTYHAPGLAAGAGVSIGTIAILLAILAWPWARTRQQFEAEIDSRRD